MTMAASEGNKGADLRQANLRGADLQGAVLEEADLHGADLAGADLRGARLGAANLEDALLEEADLQHATLRFARLRNSSLEGANLQHADLWGATLAAAELARTDLRGAALNEADLRGADLAGADLRQAVLNRADLQDARLGDADLRGADLRGARLRGANLQDARLDDLDLASSDITHVRLKGASLHRTRFAREQLGGAIGEELAGAYEEARQGYRALERNFLDLGDPDAARWAYGKRRRMQKREARKQALAAWRERRWRAAAGHYMVYAGDQLVEWLCDYGENVPRVFASLLVVYVLFIVIYGLTGSVVRVVDGPGGATRVPTRGVLDLAVFSLLAMTTSGSPVVGLLPRNELVHFLTGIQALLGIGLTGLLGFVMGNRIRR